MHDGLVVVDKPAGCTSHDVVAKLRKAYGQRKVGHAGTLDPDATGVLLVGLGRATRLLRFLSGDGQGVPRAGSCSASPPAPSTPPARCSTSGPMPITRDEVERALPRFVGDIEQLPPMVSAVKVGGRRLHELARAGQEVERAPRPVHVDRFDVGRVRTRPVSRGRRRGRVRQRHLRPLARRRSRHRARRVRAPRRAAPHAGRVVHARRGAAARRRSRPIPTAAVLPLADAMRDLERVDVDAEQARAVSHGMSFASGALDGARRRSRTRSSAPTARCSRSTTTAAPRCDPPSSSSAHRERGSVSACGSSTTSTACRPRSTTDPARSSPSACTTACTSVTTRCCASCASSPTRAASPRCASPSTATRPRSCGPDSAPKLLTTPEQKLELLAATGYLDLAFVLHFDEARSQEPAEDFVREVLAERRARAARRGRRRLPLRQGARRRRRAARSAWAPSSASRCSASASKPRRNVGPGGTIYSSTRIRELLAEGDVRGAAALLGRPHEVRGRGGRGRPTRPRARLPHRQRRGPEPLLPPRRRHLRGHVRRRRRRRAHGRDLARPPPDLLRVGRRVPARGVRPRLRRRPLRPGRDRSGSSSTSAASRSSTPSTH